MRSELNDLIESAQLNPMAVQKKGIEYLEKVRGGEIEVVDASNAFVYLGEMQASMYCNAIRRDELLDRRQYPVNALTRDELYHHMSDIDHVDMFSKPSVATLGILFNKDEIIEKSVDTGVNGIRRLTIPRHTEIKAGQIPFTLQYPIDIRILAHGDLHIVYDTQQLSPLQVLETNEVKKHIDNYNQDHLEYLLIETPVLQMQLKSRTIPLSGTKSFNKQYRYDDQFYYCRVFSENAAGGWEELITTFSDKVFDPLVPTALLRLLDDNQLNVSIPQIYYSTKLVTRNLRIDIYTTMGALEVALTTYGSDMFVPTWRDLDESDKGRYTAPVARLIDSRIVALSPATGGSNQLTFEKLKERVIHNGLGKIEIPITNIQIQSQLDRLTDAGFSCTTDVNNATKRLYLATRELPDPEIAEVSTGMGSNVVTLTKTVEEIIHEADVRDNGERLTILPTTLYRDNGGYLTIVDREERAGILALKGDLLTDAVNSDTLVYTPFHYVYDFAESVFTVRPYYFGSPAIERRFFVQDNPNLGVGVSSSSHQFIRTDNGWKIRVMTSSTESLKALDDEAVVAQLAFRPVGELVRVYLNGTLLGRDPDTKEWIFDFDFDSTWDVDPSNSIYLDGFEAQGISPHPYPASMSTTFDIFYAVNANVIDGESSDVDRVLGSFLIDHPVLGLYHEQLTVTLGHELSGLWVRARSTISEHEILRYEEDVPRRRTENKIKRDPETGSIVTELDGDGNKRVVYEYRAGEVWEENGIVVYLHRVGEPILQDGQPIVVSPRKVQRMVELCTFDGTYYFANSKTDTEYKRSVPDQIVEWVNITLLPLRKVVIEETKLLFHPKATIGQIEAIVDGGDRVTMEAGQALTITYFVTEVVDRDEVLKDAIRQSTRSRVRDLLREQIVSQDGLEAELKKLASPDALAVDVEGLGGFNNYRVVSMADESGRMVIGKKLQALPNDTYSVVDDIEVKFERHKG